MTAYIDRITGIETSVAIKAPVKAATTANITLSGEQTIDGVSVVSGDRVLVKDQTSAIDNGIWDVSTGTWSRSDDFNGVRDAVRGTEVLVTHGATSANARYVLTTTDPSIGVTTLAFTTTAVISDGSQVNAFSDLAAMTSADIAVGEIVRVRNTGYLYARAADAATDSHLDYSGSGGVKLYVRPFAFAAYDAAAMGLTMDGTTDDSAKIEILGQWIADNGGGVLFLPAGDMGWSARVEIDMPATTTFSGGYESIAVIGQGAGQTRCILPNTNTTGGIKITRNSRPQTADIKGVGFYSKQIKGTTVADATTSGIGIWMASGWNPSTPTALGWGTQPHHQVIVENCFVGSALGLNYGRWSGGIQVDYAFFPQIRGNSVETNFWNSETDATPDYETADGTLGYSFGLDMRECYTPSVQGNRIKGRWDYCARIWSDQASPSFEDFAIGDNIFDGKAKYGLVVEHTDSGYDATNAIGEPGGRIWGNHFNAHNKDCILDNVRHFSFTGNFVHLATSGFGYLYSDETGLSLVNCQGGQITGNAFGEVGHYTSGANCSRSVVIDSKSANLAFDANSHMHVGIAYDCSAADAMSISFGPSDVFGYRQADGNWRYPEYYHHERTAVRQRVHAPPLNFTPVVTIGGSTTGITYTTQVGRITRRGDVAEYLINIVLSSKGGLTGTVLITGTPHPPLFITPLVVANMSGDTGLSAERNIRAFMQANGDISVRVTTDSSAPYADAVLGGANITDTWSIYLSSTVTLAGARDTARSG